MPCQETPDELDRPRRNQNCSGHGILPAFRKSGSASCRLEWQILDDNTAAVGWVSERANPQEARSSKSSTFLLYAASM